MNTPPQVDGLHRHLSAPFPTTAEASGPSWRSGTAAEYSVENVSDRIPRPLHRRLAPDTSTDVETAFGDYPRTIPHMRFG